MGKFGISSQITFFIVVNLRTNKQTKPICSSVHVLSLGYNDVKVRFIENLVLALSDGACFFAGLAIVFFTLSFFMY